jgi:hypothetical protein
LFYQFLLDQLTLKLFTRLFLIATSILLLNSCETEKEKSERIAKKYCSSCHIFPDPALLDKKTWRDGVLPEMAFRMGLDYSQLRKFSEDEMKEVLRALPSQQMVSNEEWDLIQQYYADNAPDSVQGPSGKPHQPLTQFEVSEVKLPDEFPQVTLLKYDSISKKLFVGTRSRMLYTLTPEFSIDKSIELHSPSSDIIIEKNGILLTCMGVMDPNDKYAGRLIRVKENEVWHDVLADSLKRPVHLQMADLNNDRQNDFIISAFGNYTGALLVFEKKNDSLVRHIIHRQAGTRKTVVKDFNGDGLNDMLTLISQGDEQIMLLINQGKFQFRPQLLLRFPPVYGSSYFEIVDFNKDGHYDILYTNGDNADYSQIIKPYHGVRLFQNDGKNQFSEAWFHPMPGASMAMAKDFDQDGDLDIAAISFFPNFSQHPEQGFIYLKNDNGKFTASSSPLGASGRWLVMETADIDHDNDEDILLGSMNFSLTVPDSLFKYWTSKNTSILIMKNKLNTLH